MTEWLTTGAAAERVGVTRTTMNEYIRAGRIPAHQTAGGHYRIAVEALEAFLQTRQRVPSKAQAQAQVIAVAHHAGGVGKTTTTLNLGYALAAAGRRVLVVDLDPQGDLSGRLGVTPTAPDLGTALLDPGVAPHPLPVHWGTVRLDVLAGSLSMAGVELRLTSLNSREMRLKNALAQAQDGVPAALLVYDYILLDCPPSLSSLTQNALYAADSVLIPVQAQDKAYLALDLLLGTVRDVNRFRTPPLGILGMLLTMTDATVMAGQVEAALRQDYGGQVFAARIPDRVAARTEHRRHAPVSVSAPDNDTARAYAALAQEVIARVEH